MNQLQPVFCSLWRRGLAFSFRRRGVVFASAAAAYLEEGDSHARSGGENAASGLRQECEMKEVWGSEKREQPHGWSEWT